MSPRITKNRLDEHDGGLQCEMCGYPLDMDDVNPICYVIEDMEHLAFCSKTCAREFMDQAEYDMSDSNTEGGYAIL